MNNDAANNNAPKNLYRLWGHKTDTTEHFL